MNTIIDNYQLPAGADELLRIAARFECASEGLMEPFSKLGALGGRFSRLGRLVNLNAPKTIIKDGIKMIKQTPEMIAEVKESITNITSFLNRTNPPSAADERFKSNYAKVKEGLAIALDTITRLQHNVKQAISNIENPNPPRGREH